MREHLYCGKRADNGEWVEGCLVYDTHHTCIRDFGYEYHEVLPETVCEYTGLTDKNGKKIFEGHIVQEIGDYEIQGVVEWQKNECRYLVQLLGNNDWVTMDGYEWEIIGNIHDNPELLEGEML